MFLAIVSCCLQIMSLQCIYHVHQQKHSVSFCIHNCINNKNWCFCWKLEETLQTRFLFLNLDKAYQTMLKEGVSDYMDKQVDGEF